MQCAHFAFRAVCRTSLAKRFIFHSPKVLFTENGIECSQGLFLYEHSIFLFYVQRYTQMPDLAVDSDPHRGADRSVVVVGIVAAHIDRAVIVDKGGIILIEAGRPQPPPAGGFVTFGIAVTCICSV